MDAIRAYTYNGAYAAFDEEKLGSIEPGKLADLIIINDNSLLVQTEAIKELEVVRIKMDGKTVYKKLLDRGLVVPLSFVVIEIIHGFVLISAELCNQTVFL